jgi:hypothetical protein
MPLLPKEAGLFPDELFGLAVPAAEEPGGRIRAAGVTARAAVTSGRRLRSPALDV